MQPVLKTGNVKVTNTNGPHGKDDPANMPGAMHEHMDDKTSYPQNLNFLHWRKAGTPSG